MPAVYYFLNAAGMVAVFNGVIFLSGRAMLRSMRRKGQHLRTFHGWYVWVWMMGGVAVGGLFIPWSVPMYQGGPLLMGFLSGWFGGTLHGLAVLRKYVEPPAEDESSE
jgi:uncharacterized membrane protein